MASSTPTRETNPAKDKRMEDFFAALRRQRSIPASTDFKIVCGDTTYNVHRLVISCHSEYFKRLSEGGFKEASEGVATLHDDPPLAIKLMVEYFYSFDTPALGHLLDHHLSDFSGEAVMAAEVWSWVFSTADKYNVPGLKALMVELTASYLRSAMGLSPSFFSSCLISATFHAYTHSPPHDQRMRKVILEAWMTEDRKMMRAASKKDFDRLLLEAPDFASELVSALSGIKMKDAEDEEM